MHLPCSNFDAVVYCIGSYNHHLCPSTRRFYSLNTNKTHRLKNTHSEHVHGRKRRGKTFEKYSTKLKRAKEKQAAFFSDNDDLLAVCSVDGNENLAMFKHYYNGKEKDLATRHENLRERKSITHTPQTHRHIHPIYLMWFYFISETHKFWLSINSPTKVTL
uniref:(northern house mosquito) hypothetical protein n=1 Tax=Culex pipiens TaxID=7175 RepID=A0A8D8PJ13_CULPI